MLKNRLVAVVSLTLVFLMVPTLGSPPAATSSKDARAEKIVGGPIFESSTLTGTSIWTGEIQPGFIPAFGFVLDFAADGTGASYEKANTSIGSGLPEDIPETFTWTVDLGVLNILFDDYTQPTFPFITYPYDELADVLGFDQEVVDFMNVAFENGEFPEATQVEMIQTTLGRSVSINSAVGRRLQVTTNGSSENSIDAVLVDLGWPGPLPRGDGSQVLEQELYLNGEITNVLLSPPAAGDTWAVPFLFRPIDPLVTEETEQGLFVDSLTLDGAGSTSTGALSDKSFAWLTTADGLVLNAGTDQYTYTPIEFDGSVYFSLATYLSEGNVQLRIAQWIARSDGTGPTLGADLVQPIPFYWQSGINSSLASLYRDSGQLDPSAVFGYSFINDGTSFRIFPPFEDACVPDDGQSCFSPEGAPFWSWTASEDSVVRNQAWTFSNRQRSWKVMNYQPGGLATVLEWEVYDFIGSPWSFLINPRINTLELFNLSSWPEEWADSDGFYPDTDGDGDGIADAADNCLQVATTDLRDGDADGIGTACDTDHNQDCLVNFIDLSLFAGNFLGTDENYDYSGDGLVNFVDLIQLRDAFFSSFLTGPDVSGVPNICN